MEMLTAVLDAEKETIGNGVGVLFESGRMEMVVIIHTKRQQPSWLAANP
jgi:hypothetical protein